MNHHFARQLVLSSLVATSTLCSPAGAADRENKGPLTIDEAMAEPISWAPALSPSGRYLAMLQRDGDLHQIVVADIQDESAASMTHRIPHGTLRWVAWDSDDRLVFSAMFWIDKSGKPMAAEDAKYRYSNRVMRLLAMDRSGKNLALLFAGHPHALSYVNLTRVTDFLPDDPRHIVAPAWQGSSYDLFKVDTYTGKAHRIAKGSSRTFLWFTDKAGDPAFRIDSNWLDTLAYVYARKGPAGVDADHQEWEQINTIPLRHADNASRPEFYPLHPGPEPNTYYVSARPDGADTTGIHLYDFVARKYLRTLATEPGVDLDSMLYDSRTAAFAGVGLYKDRHALRLADPKLQAHFDALDRYFGGAVDVYLHDHDRDMQNWLLRTVGPRDRGTWHVYRLKEKHVREVAHPFAPIDARRLGTTKVLRYAARDGLEIMGYLTGPPSPPQGRPPALIMLPHGGPEARDYNHFDNLVQLLASRGYQIFQPNFRGSAGFGKRFADAGKRQWGAAMQDDLTDGFEYLVKNGYASRDNACIVGASYGGYAALAAATLTPGLYRCTVAIAPVSDLLRQVRYLKRMTRNDDESWQYIKRQYGDPVADQAMLEARSPLRLANAAAGPILLIHGDADPIVPIEQSNLMDKALRQAGKDVRLVKLRGAGHSPQGKDLRTMYREVLDFLEAHLPATADRPAAAAPPQPP